MPLLTPWKDASNGNASPEDAVRRRQDCDAPGVDGLHKVVVIANGLIGQR